MLLLCYYFLLVYMGVFGHIPSSEEIQQLETIMQLKYTHKMVNSLENIMWKTVPIIALDSISPYLITALLAIEDKRFFF